MLRWLQAAPRLAAARYATAADAAELRVAVVGLGAIGSTVFAKLARLAASDARAVGAVTAVARPRQLSEWLSGERARLTLTANDAGGSRSVELEFERAGRAAVAVGAPNVTVRTLEGELPEDERFDVVLLAVKAYDSSAAIRELQRAERLVKRDAVCVLLQNGLGEGLPGPEEREQTAWSFMNGVTFIGGRVEAFGRVVTSGAESGVTYLAPVVDSHDESKADALAALLRAAGLRCEVLTTGEMQAILWRKLIVNAGINPIASLLDGPNKVVGACEWSRRCVAMVVAEAFAVAQAEQVPLDCSEQELVDEVLRVAINTGSNTCSMLADLRRGSRTEVDAISGRIVALGRRHGVATPANELLLSLVKARERASA